jgi:hypothetical protein
MHEPEFLPTPHGPFVPPVAGAGSFRERGEKKKSAAGWLLAGARFGRGALLLRYVAVCMTAWAPHAPSSSPFSFVGSPPALVKVNEPTTFTFAKKEKKEKVNGTNRRRLRLTELSLLPQSGLHSSSSSSPLPMNHPPPHQKASGRHREQPDRG